jgi:phage-related protein
MKKVSVRFFVQESGSEPVHEWLRSLSRGDQKRIGDDIRRVEFGWPIGMPTCRALGKSLYEVRTNLRDRIARVMFTIVEDRMVLLHGFIKKSQATPAPDIELARKRLQAVQRGER